MPPPASPARLHYSLGVVLEWVGWLDGAAQALRDAVERDPGLAEGHFHLAEVMGRQGRWLAASAALADAVRLRPCSAEFQGNLVLALGRAGRLEASLDALRRLIALCPNQAELHLLQSVLLRRLNRPHEAIRCLRHAARLPTLPGWNRFYLGEALVGSEPWRVMVNSHRSASRVPPRTGQPGLTRRPASVSPLRRAGSG